MTITARGISKGFPMRIIVLMAINTIRRDRLVRTPRMAFGAVNAGVLTDQGELTHRVMIKLKVMTRETCLLMATVATLRSKLATVDIAVTTSTVTGRWLPFAPGLPIRSGYFPEWHSSAPPGAL